jgi:hypothetical protein
MQVTFPMVIRRAAPALGLLLLASLTAVPASAQYQPAYPPPPGPGYNGNGMWNNASYYVYQYNSHRPGNPTGNTDFGYATIPPPVTDDSTTNASADQTDGRMYVYNFTGGVGPVYENPFDDLHCFPC